MRLICTLFVALVGPVVAACTTDSPAVAWSCHELSFQSAVAYRHPINDLTVEGRFAKAGHADVSVLGFWDGDQTYRVRVALPASGEWAYTVTSSDAASGIQATGTLTVVDESSDDVFVSRGWPRASPDRRSLTYADGTPFFYLGDAAWEMAWASTEGQIETYLADRQSKAFNVIHLVTNSHQMFHPWHVTNKDGTGDRYLLNEDQSLLNPAYFDRLDEIVEQAADAGMAVALVPIWGTFGEPHRTDPDAVHTRYYTADQARTHARYVGARYAGHNVIWMVGGDRAYDTEEKRSYWDAFARELRRASGGLHLMSAYAGGYSGSFSYWPTPPEWMDFHMYVASHFAEMRYITDDKRERLEDRFGALVADGGYHWLGALEGYAQAIPLPVLSIESNFEDLPGRFWEYVQAPGGVRISDAEVRLAAYTGLLSGSTAGYTYGANGVWSWSNTIPPGTNGGFQFRYTAIEALALPGSAQMTRLRAFAESHDWHKWVPRPDLVQETDTDHFVAASVWDSTLVVYCPVGTRQFLLDMPEASVGRLALDWTSPTTGETRRTETDYEGSAVPVQPPSQSDWLLVARVIPQTIVSPPPPSGVRLVLAGANPGPSLQLNVHVSAPLEARWDLFDTVGRRVRGGTLLLTPGATALSVAGLASGVYLGQLTWTDDQGRAQTARQRVTIVR